jgi:hypothetical protein
MKKKHLLKDIKIVANAECNTDEMAGKIIRRLLKNEEPLSPCRDQYRETKTTLDLSETVSRVNIDFIEFTHLSKVEVDIIISGYPGYENKEWNVVIEGRALDFPNIIERSPSDLTILCSDRIIQGKVYVTDTCFNSDKARFRILLAGDGELVNDEKTQSNDL